MQSRLRARARRRERSTRRAPGAASWPGLHCPEARRMGRGGWCRMACVCAVGHTEWKPWRRAQRAQRAVAICVLVLFVGWSSRWEGWITELFCPKLQRGSGLFTMLTILIAKQVQLSISRHRAHWSISNYALCGWRGLTGRKKERHARRPRTGRSHPSLGLSVFSLSFFTGRSTTSLLRYIGCYFSLKLSCLYKHDHPVGGGGKGSRSHGSRVVFWMLCSRTAQFYGPDRHVQVLAIRPVCRLKRTDLHPC